MSDDEIAGLEACADSLYADNASLHEQVTKLQAFKDWVHAYLDGKGIPHHPPGSHGAAGCRIGDRMDYVFEKLARYEAALNEIACWSEDSEVTSGFDNLADAERARRALKG